MQPRLIGQTFLLSMGATALVLALGGCTSEPTYGDRLLQAGEAESLLGQKWNEGQALITRGNKLIQQGTDKIAEGKKLMADGQAALKEGQDDVQRGQAMVTEVEKAQVDRPSAPFSK